MLFQNNSGNPFILALFTAQKMYAGIAMDSFIEVAKVKRSPTLYAWKSHCKSSFIGKDYGGGTNPCLKGVTSALFTC
jgi:hypothetical protein